MRSYFTMNALSILSLAALAVGCDGVEIDGVEYPADDVDVEEAEEVEAETPATAPGASDELSAHAATLAPSGSWTLTGPMAVSHAGQSAVTLPSGKIFVMGNNNNYSSARVSEVYDPAIGAWSLAAPSPNDHYQGVIAPLSNGKVLAIGGAGKKTDLYDPATNTWTANIAGSPGDVYNRGGQAVTLPNGKLLVTGGGDDLLLAFNPASIFDPATNKWTGTGSMLQHRDYAGLVVLPNGKVLAAAGGSYWTPSNGSNTAELYDPATGKWTATGNLNAYQGGATATLLPNGKVLLVGGNPTPELYDPATGTWSPTGSTHSLYTGPNPLVFGQAAVRLGSGKVLVAGGTSTKAETYDPATGTWTVANDRLLVRPGPNMSLLPGGLVLVSGGGVLGSEIYTP